MVESVEAAPPSQPPHVGNTRVMAELVRGVRVDRRFYMAMAICAIVIAALGFAPSGLDRTARRGPLTPLVAAHAAMSIAWCQSAPKFDPVSASNFDPFERRVLTVALASSELAGVAETGRARAV